MARARGTSVWPALVSLGAVMLLGVSGAIAALGDTLFPVTSVAAGLSLDLDPAASIFVRLRLFHPMIAAAAGAWLLFYSVSIVSRRPDARVQAWIVVVMVGAQLGAGVTNLLLLAPVWMQVVHLLLADLLWIAFVLLAATTLQEPHARQRHPSTT